jgi:hypothetical protein
VVRGVPPTESRPRERARGRLGPARAHPRQWWHLGRQWWHLGVVATVLVTVMVATAFAQVGVARATDTRSRPVAVAAAVTGLRPSQGGWQVDAAGGVWPFGGAPALGSVSAPLNQPIVGMASTPDGHGYWMVASDGGIFALGDAGFYGSLGSIHLNQPIVGMASTANSQGYWLVASDGGVFGFGNARFFGSMAGQHLNQPIVGIAPTPDGGGYWLVAADGGVFSFGNASFHGSMAGTHLDAPIVGIAATSSAKGYWLDGSDGGVFAFGNATFFGSVGGTPGVNDAVGPLVPTPDQRGYWLSSASFLQDGWEFGDATGCWVNAGVPAGTKPPIQYVGAAIERPGPAICAT